jgi:Tol biopolymer transport system component
MVAYPGTDPDGSHLIYVANIDGTNIRALEETAPTGVDVLSPQFSPDGSQIVYQAKGEGGLVGDLFLVDVATGETARLTHLRPLEAGFFDMAPTFSPDGQTVLFNRPSSSATERQSWNLWLVPATGGKPTLVLRDAALGRLSPEGGTIAFFKPSSLRNPFSGDLWLADADGTDARHLVRGTLLAPSGRPTERRSPTRIGAKRHLRRRRDDGRDLQGSR